MMKAVLLTGFFVQVLIGQINSQDCYAIFRTRDKDIGWETYYGSLERDGWYVSIAKQFYREDSIPHNYYMLFYRAKKWPVKQHVVASFREVRILLENQSFITLDSAKYTNHKEFQGGVSLKVFLTDEEIATLSKSRMVRIHFDNVEINFGNFARDKIKRIIDCLLKQE